MIRYYGRLAVAARRDPHRRRDRRAGKPQLQPRDRCAARVPRSAQLAHVSARVQTRGATARSIAINTRNVADLAPVWTMSTGTAEGHQAPPIVNDGVMFVTTPFNQVLAIDAKTGDLLWRYRHQMPADIRMGHPTNRGVALYGDKVYTATSDARVVALDAKTGAVVWNKAVENYNNGYYMTIAPLAARGRIMVGVSGGERGIRGFVVALDADTGEQVWKTYTVPAPGEPGNDTWPGDSWRTGGAPVWVTGSFDPKLGLTYWGTGNPGPWTGDARPGDNLYTNSVVALDVETGALKAYHQYHWNDSWDWDEVSAPLLIDLPRNGRTVPGLVHAGRNGYLWMLERSATGISFIDAKPYVKQNVFTSIDPVTGRPEYDMEHKPGINKPAIYCPSLWGGKDWPPAAYNPGTGYLYIPANENLCQHLVGEDVEYRPGQQFTGAQTVDFLVAEGADHIGELQAWNLRTGERVWTHEFESPNWGPVHDDRRRARVQRRHQRSLLPRLRRGVRQAALAIPHELRHHGRADLVRGRRRAVHRRAVGLGRRRARHDGRIDRARGTETIVPQGGVVWVFALDR